MTENDSIMRQKAQKLDAKHFRNEMENSSETKSGLEVRQKAAQKQDGKQLRNEMGSTLKMHL